MLQTLRDHTQGWIAGVIVTIIILTFALWGIHSYFVGGTNNNVVAEVNGVDITKEQLSVTYERLKRQSQNQFEHSANGIGEPLLKDQALQMLINVEALKQSSYAQGFHVYDTQIDNYLQSMPEFQVDGRFSVERFQQILSSTLLSTSDFLEIIKTTLLIDQPKLGIVFTSFALPDEITYTTKLVNQVRQITFLTIPLQHFLNQPIIISPEKIQAYYQQHKNDFMTPEQVSIEYIALSQKELTLKMVPTDAVLKVFYNENINSYTKPMQWKLARIDLAFSQETPSQIMKTAEAVAQSLRAGAEVTSVATKYHAATAVTNWLSLNQMTPDMQKAVVSLTKVGQVSPIFKTENGLAVVKLVDVLEPQVQPYESVKEKVKEAYIHQHAEEKFAQLREQLADAAYEHPESLQFAAKTLNLPIKSSELFTKEKSGKDLAQFKKIRDTAFGNDVLNLQNNSDVIQLNPESVVVIRLKAHLPSHLLPLNTVSKQISEKLKQTEAEEKAANFAKMIQARLERGALPEQIAKENQLTWHQSGLIGRYTNKIDSAILDLAFRLPNPQLKKSKVAYGIVKIPTGFAIVALLAVKEGEIADKKQYAIFAEQVQNSEGLLEYELYRLSQMEHAKIKILQ